MELDRQIIPRTLPAWDARRVVFDPDNLGINYFELNQHGGRDPNRWLTTPYDVAKVEADLAMLASLGITLLRIWAPTECVIDFSGTRVPRPTMFARNLQDFLTRCIAYDMRCIVVMADGYQSDRGRPPFDGKFLWERIQSQEGRTRYAEAYVAYVDLIAPLDQVCSWEIANEPYGNLTWAPYPQRLRITKDQIHAYLLTAYEALKQRVNEPVGFSELEEEEQAQYRVFSDPVHRQTYIDDCTDYYSMHIYRARAAQMADFRDLTDKPKYLSEVGHYNYDDPTGEFYAGQPAHLELYQEGPNLRAVIELSTKALNSGFAFVMPWDASVNPGMFRHRPDGRHTIGELPRWMESVLLAGERVSARSRATGSET